MNIHTVSNPALSAAAMQGASAPGQAASAQAASSRTVKAPDPGAGAQANSPSLDQIAKALDEVRAVVQPVAQSLQFTMDQDSGRTIIKVMDTETNDVIRQIPSEEILTMSRAIDKLRGMLVKQTA
jgi:flagellar protein FlaG